MITLRNLPPALEQKLRKRAKQRGVSMNKAVIGVLEEAFGLAKKPRTVYHDLDHLAGTWTKEEADEFDAALRKIRVIDPELWKK